MQFFDDRIRVKTAKSPTMEIPRDAVPRKMEENLPVIRRSIRPLHRQPCACKLCTYRTTKDNHEVRPTPTVLSGKLEGSKRIHLDEKPSEQNASNFTVNTATGIKTHRSGNEKEKNCALKFSDYRTNKRSILAEQKRMHTDQKRFVCPLCPYNVTEFQNYKRHIRLFHSKGKFYACDLCEYRTPDKFNLKKHLDVHNSVRRYSCSMCDYKAGQPSNLKDHMRVHTGDRPYACDQCDHRSKTLSQIKRHMGTHTRRINKFQKYFDQL